VKNVTKIYTYCDTTATNVTNAVETRKLIFFNIQASRLDGDLEGPPAVHFVKGKLIIL
jgi:hypothetical protein